MMEFLFNSFLTDDNTRSCGQYRSRSDCIEHAVWSLIYIVHIFIPHDNWMVPSSCNGSIFLANEKQWFIYSVVQELTLVGIMVKPLAFADGIDHKKTAQNMQNDLGSMLPTC